MEMMFVVAPLLAQRAGKGLCELVNSPLECLGERWGRKVMHKNLRRQSRSAGVGFPSAQPTPAPGGVCPSQEGIQADFLIHITTAPQRCGSSFVSELPSQRRPPAMTSVSPVIHAASGEARKTAAGAMSSG